MSDQIVNAKLNINEKMYLITHSLDAGSLSPLAVFAAIHHHYPDAALLESAATSTNSRFSFIGIQPYAQVKTSRNLTYKAVNGITTLHHEHPFSVLRTLEKQVESDNASLPTTHAIGFISYDAVRLFENIPDRHASDELPDILFNYYQTTITYDHENKKIAINILTNSDASAKIILDKLLTQINSAQTFHPLQFDSTKNHSTAYESDIDDTAFMNMVEKAKQYIKKGDAFQIVLSRRFTEKYTVSPLTLYQALCQVSPAPYMFFIPLSDRIIIGASPERLIGVDKGTISINPIAGTRRRDKTKSDQDIEQDLLTDEKEVAEHMMLVDLARNDIGAVCKPGSIEIAELLKVKHYSHISHITSLVTGKLDEKFDALDALAHAFPAGTLSGAPKIRAMEIIDELESSRRGLYGGAICRLDHAGNLDTCIAIRMAVLRNGIATIRTGAGIVYDSNPEAEAHETRHKARNMLETIRTAHQGVQS